MSLKICTFNIRYGSAPDNINHWENRKEKVLDTLIQSQADIIALQECEYGQLQYLQAKLPQYHILFAGRDDGLYQGEMLPLFYKKEQLTQITHHFFWLSESPHIPGSKSWHMTLPRITTWATFYYKRQIISIINTHLDHKNAQAREQSALLLNNYIKSFNHPTILMGDFNTAPHSKPYKILTEQLIDSNPKGHGTYHEFTGSKTMDRIDWILSSPSWKVKEVYIDTSVYEGRYASDHFAVMVTFL